MAVIQWIGNDMKLKTLFGLAWVVLLWFGETGYNQKGGPTHNP